MEILYNRALVLLLSLTSVVCLPSLENTIQDYKTYDLVCDLMIGDKIPVRKYVSPRTGLTVVIGNVEGPLVNGYFALSTEASSDDGLPHTLEHLVFLGSEKYPFKGALDLIANRCLASGTNAWTAIDHTAYTITTAGKEGFLNFLPIYMDHLLYPTLKESGFTTEVYHVTSKGEDAGVVFSEMQARENGKGDRLWREFNKQMYPEPSGYRFQTGGMMDNLRNSTNIDKIRKYHARFYRPENLNVIVVGQVKPEEIFEALAEIEEKIVKKGSRSTYKKPWENPIPPLVRSVDKEIFYNSDKEKQGSVIVGWRGPCPVSQYQEFQGLRILLTYLTYSSISTLRKIFVEKDSAIALSVSGFVDHYSTSAIGFSFSGVALKDMTKIKPMLYSALHQITTGAISVDMKIINTFLNNLSIREESNLEGSPQSTVAGLVIQQFLYGSTCHDLDERLNKADFYTYLLRQRQSYWINLIKKYMLNSPSVTIRATPSIARADRTQKEKKLREQRRRTNLGSEGLMRLKQELLQAKEENEKAPPPSVISSVPVPGTEDITYHYLSSSTNINPDQVPNGISTTSPSYFDFDDIPVKMQVHNIHSKFVEISAILDTSKLKDKLRQYLPIFLDLALESSIMRDGELIRYEQIVKQRDADLLSSGASLSLGSYGYFSCGGFCHVAMIRMEVDMDRYELGVQWMYDLLFNVVLDKDRAKIKVNNLLNSISGYKTSASTITSVIYNNIMFQNNTNLNSINAFKMEKFLNTTLKRLNSEPEKVIEELNEVMHELTRLDNIVISIGTNFEELAKTKDPAASWRSFAPPGNKDTTFNFVRIPTIATKLDVNLANMSGFIYGLKSVDSAYLRQVVTTPLTSSNHPDVPALSVAIKYITQTEGPLWREIRGKGLAYTYQMFLSTSHGNIFFALKKASQLTEAYKAGLNIINSFMNGTRQFEQSLLESAKSSLIYGVIAGESRIYQKYWQGLKSFYDQIPLDQNRKSVEKISKVEISDVERVFKKYLEPLLDPASSMIIIICNPSKIQDTKKFFKNSYGVNLEELGSIDNSRFGS